MEVMSNFMKEENLTFTALCDVWKLNLEKRAQWIRVKTGKSS